MKLETLVTVPDSGAAEVVTEALRSAGIAPTVTTLGREHAYAAQLSAESFRVQVPAERIAEARQVLAQVESELADEMDAQAGAPEEPAAQGEGGRTDPTSPRKLSWAVVLGALVPFPVTSFYARSPRAGMIWVGVFLGGLGMCAAHMTPEGGPDTSGGLSLALLAKGCDLVWGVLQVVRQRR